jgi:hypothetical protein
MWWLAAAAVQTGLGYAGSRRAEDAAEDAGKYNANNIRLETAEAVRRSQLQTKQTIGGSIASMGSAGVQMTGTPQNQIDMVEREMNRQTDWLAKSGEMAAQSALRGGNNMSDQIRFQNISNTANTWSNAFTNNWWATKAPNTGSTGVV